MNNVKFNPGVIKEKEKLIPPALKRFAKDTENKKLSCAVSAI